MQQSLFAAMAAPQAAEAPKADKASASVEGLLKTPLSEAVFTVLDLETTGLSAKKNAITEMTAIQYKNGEEIGRYSTLVKPTEPIPPEVEKLTGISNEMVQNSPALVMAMSGLCHFAGTSPLVVGHNVNFDLGFIREKLEQTGLSASIPAFDGKSAFCTRILALKAFPGLPSYEGIVVANHCGVHNPNPHRAEADVRMSAGILFEIIKRLKVANPALKTVEDLLNYQGRLA